MQFVFEQIRVGGDRNLAYLIGDRDAGVAAIFDPSYAPETVVQRAEAQGLKVTCIVNTHGHADHTNGNEKARELTGAPLAAFRSADSAPELPLDDGAELEVGALSLRALHTPGHKDDHLCFYSSDLRAALTGDLLFVGKVGGTGKEEDARVEFESLARLLREIPGDTTVWPGHDYGCRPSSTAALEKSTNPFLCAGDVDEFLALKSDWKEFKLCHGLV